MSDQRDVLYTYRCKACGHSGQRRLPDETHDGEETTCDVCASPVTLEWDDGVKFDIPNRA
jgi:predicted nucleic acid-binding Zn ribbon protein